MSMTPYEQKVVDRLEFICRALIVVQQRLLWCAIAALPVGFAAVYILLRAMFG